LSNEGRRVITIEELRDRVKKQGPKVGLRDIQVTGVVTIKDKDGNVKSQMEVTDIDVAKEK
jgi:predicted RNase H-like nuclease